jgi:serine/threonine-protein kinase PknK
VSISSDGLDGYEIQEQIGRGGFATVYRASDVAHGRSVAIKVLTGALSADEQRRFDRERRAVGQLANHPNVVPVFESGTTAEGEAYLVLEHASGGSLGQRLLRDGPMPWSEALDAITGVASAVEAAHEVGIRHRDIKPDNILLSQYGVPKLSDFGIASLASGNTTATGATMTVSHSPPEMLQGSELTDAVDVYSMASTFHHLVAGHPPFARPDDANIGALITRVFTEPPPGLEEHGVPAAVAQVIEQSMAKRPEDRPQSARAFADRLRAAASGTSAAPPVAQPTEPRTTAIDRAALGLDLRSDEPRPVDSSVPAQLVPPSSVPAQPSAVVPPSPAPVNPTGTALPPVLDSEPKAKNRWPVLAALVAVLVLGGGGVWALTQQGGDESTTTSTSEGRRPRGFERHLHRR